MIKLPVFKKKKKCSYLCNKYVSVKVLRILFLSSNEGKNCKYSLGILMQYNLLFLNLYIDIGSKYITNMKTCSVCHWKQNKNKAGIKFSSLAIPGYCFNIFG